MTKYPKLFTLENIGLVFIDNLFLPPLRRLWFGNEGWRVGPSTEVIEKIRWCIVDCITKVKESPICAPAGSARPPLTRIRGRRDSIRRVSHRASPTPTLVALQSFPDYLHLQILWLINGESTSTTRVNSEHIHMNEDRDEKYLFH